MTEKIPFFISPAYSVPRITISRRLKLTSTEVEEVIPAVNRLAGNCPLDHQSRSGWRQGKKLREGTYAL